MFIISTLSLRTGAHERAFKKFVWECLTLSNEFVVSKVFDIILRVKNSWFQLLRSLTSNAVHWEDVQYEAKGFFDF